MLPIIILFVTYNGVCVTRHCDSDMMRRNELKCYFVAPAIAVINIILLSLSYYKWESGWKYVCRYPCRSNELQFWPDIVSHRGLGRALQGTRTDTPLSVNKMVNAAMGAATHNAILLSSGVWSTK